MTTKRLDAYDRLVALEAYLRERENTPRKHNPVISINAIRIALDAWPCECGHSRGHHPAWDGHETRGCALCACKEFRPIRVF